jgi:hypothetical protein
MVEAAQALQTKRKKKKQQKLLLLPQRKLQLLHLQKLQQQKKLHLLKVVNKLLSNLYQLKQKACMSGFFFLDKKADLLHNGVIWKILPHHYQR